MRNDCGGPWSFPQAFHSALRIPESALFFILIVAGTAPLSAQLTKDFQLHGTGTLVAQRFAGAGVGLSIRPPGRARFGINASAGDLEGQLAGRAGVLASFHLNPI